MAKEITVKVATNVDDSQVQRVEDKINEINRKKLQLNVDAKQEALAETEHRIKSLKTFIETANTSNVNFHIDDTEILKAKDELEQLESKIPKLQFDVEDAEIKQAKYELDQIDDTPVKVEMNVDDTAVQTAMSNIQDGINQTKQGLNELGQGFGTILEAAGKQETNRAFLQNTLKNGELVDKKLKDINQTVADLPGDDSILQGLLSQAVAKDASLTTKELGDMGTAAADYFAAMENFGKSSSEAFQDMNNYILTGNTAEIERSPILANHIDKLKEGTSIQERSVLLQKALNAEGWGGMSKVDTYNNALETFNGMIERGKYNLGGLFLEATKGGMDAVMGLDELTGGLASAGLAFGTEFGPGLFSTSQGLISMGSGLSTMGKEFGGVMPMISNFAGQIPVIGGALTSLSLGPIALIIAAIVALGVAIFEVGKYFGWWSDVGGMFDAIKTGVLSLWEAFTSNEYVIQVIDLIKQGLTDAWNALSGFVNFIMSNLTGASGEFDILSWAINTLQTTLNTVGPVVVWFISTMISNFRTAYGIGRVVFSGLSIIVSTAFSIINAIVGAGRGVWSGIIGVWNQAKSIMSGFGGAVSSGLSVAGAAWNSFKSTVMGVVQPILDKIEALQDAASSVGDFIFGGGSGGVESYSSTGYGGAGGNIFNITINGNIDSDARINQLKEDFARIVDGEVKENEMVIG